MPRCIRLLIYTGNEDWLRITLKNSLPKGTNHFENGSISIVDLDEIIAKESLNNEDKSEG